MFWALVILPNKRYTQVVSKSFHVSMACLDLESADGEATSVMVEVNDDKLILCNLSKNKCVQQPLDLNFQTGDEISFFTKGKATVHLTGYLIPEDDVPELMSGEESDEEEEEEEGEAKEKLKALASKAMKRSIEEKSSKNKKQKLDSSVGATNKAIVEEDSDEDDEDFELEEDSEGESGEDAAGSESDESDEDMDESMEEKKVPAKLSKKQKEEKGKPMKKESLPAKKESINGTPNQLSAKKKKQKDGATPQAKGTPKPVKQHA
ncbi:hypothetical protein J437_LFUL000297 [Ladona fulva]|uniref:Nucleoplasmin-like domain-containing protein n=1 Tax=Ladona fulva TaxID=123851 RepID=A0A8K0K3H4_LADFU|nr:hypothetical protein J437_LFUL000297 [Ladona fulva]